MGEQSLVTYVSLGVSVGVTLYHTHCVFVFGKGLSLGSGGCTAARQEPCVLPAREESLSSFPVLGGSAHRRGGHSLLGWIRT